MTETSAQAIIDATGISFPDSVRSDTYSLNYAPAPAKILVVRYTILTKTGSNRTIELATGTTDVPATLATMHQVSENMIHVRDIKIRTAR